MSKYTTSTETIKKLYIEGQGFEWFYVVKDNPDFPEEASLIEQWEEGKKVGSINIPKDVLSEFITIVDKHVSKN